MPTWNYAVVHAHGAATVDDDLEHKRRHVEALAARYERGRDAPWVPDYDVRRLGGIVGIDDAHRHSRGQVQTESKPLGGRSRRRRRAASGERARAGCGARAPHDEPRHRQARRCPRQTCDDYGRSSWGGFRAYDRDRVPGRGCRVRDRPRATDGRRGQPAHLDGRPLRSESVGRPGDRRPNGAALRARAREARDDPARRAARRSRRAVRARRRHAGRGRVRRAVCGLQLDGVPRRGGLRRVLDGHDGLRPLDAADRHERRLQSVGGAADGARRARRAKRRTTRSSRRSRRTGTTSTPSSTTSARCATCRA